MLAASVILIDFSLELIFVWQPRSNPTHPHLMGHSSGQSANYLTCFTCAQVCRGGDLKVTSRQTKTTTAPGLFVQFSNQKPIIWSFTSRVCINLALNRNFIETFSEKTQIFCDNQLRLIKVDKSRLHVEPL